MKENNNTISEEEKEKRRRTWGTAIGLQNGLGACPVSDYLIELSERHINGEITIEDVEKLIKEHYEELEKKVIKRIKNKESGMKN